MKTKSEEEISKVEGIGNLAEEIKKQVGSLDTSKILSTREIPPPPSIIDEPEKNAKMREKIKKILDGKIRILHLLLIFLSEFFMNMFY